MLQRGFNLILVSKRENPCSEFCLFKFQCPLVGHFCSAKSTHKIEKIQECALRFLYNDHVGSYNVLLLKSQKCMMHVSQIRSPSLKISKTLNDLNPSLIKDVF